MVKGFVFWFIIFYFLVLLLRASIPTARTTVFVRHSNYMIISLITGLIIGAVR